MPSSATTLGIKVDKPVRDRLKALGKLKDRSPHWLARQAVEEFLSREKRWEREKREDEQRWNEYAQTRESFSLAEVSAWMAGLRRGKRRKWPR